MLERLGMLIFEFDFKVCSGIFGTSSSKSSFYTFGIVYECSRLFCASWIAFERSSEPGRLLYLIF